MKTYILNRLKEPSTWQGFIFIFTSLGVHLKPEDTQNITFLGLFLVGMVGSTTKG